MRKIITATFLCFFCLTQLSGCGVTHKNPNSKRYEQATDSAPDVDIYPSKIKDAVPRCEPYHPYGRRNYVVRGKSYKVRKSSKGYVRKGYASWYGTKFHGKQTSTQERYNMYGMTAASKDLPLPSYVQVTNLRNGKKIVVRVNDRGPFHSKRIIDLSYAAARKLGFAEQGVAPVKVVAIDPKTWRKKKSRKTTYAKSSVKKSVKKPVKKPVELAKNNVETIKSDQQNKSKIFLQVGAFAKLDNAKQLSDKVTKLAKEHPVVIEHKSDLYRVHVGPLASSSQGDELKALLKESGFEKVTLVDG